MEAQHDNRQVTELAGPRMPADHGLSGLGLLMQLGGSVFLGYMALLAIMPLFGGAGSGAFLVFLMGAAGVVRSAFHRAAGGALIYGSPSGHLRPVHTYVGVAVAQSVLTLLILHHIAPHSGAASIAALLLALLGWPVAVLAILHSPRLRRLAADGPPVSEDMGFEGAAILMCLLGAVGALFAGLCLYGLLKLPGHVLSSPHALLFIGVFGMLLVRSILHVSAGYRGTRGVDSDGATESAARYYNFGVVTAVVAGGALLLELVMNTLDPRALIAVSGVVYLLLVWPLILRRFYSERNFSALLAGAEGPNYRRAPDAGLTALGWLLLALGLMGLAMSLPEALSGARGGSTLLALFGAPAGAYGTSGAMAAARSPWWQVGVSLAQLWAALELIGMTDRHRLAGTVYGAAATAVTAYLVWPALHQLGHGYSLDVASPAQVGSFVVLAMALVVPVGTLLLVNRSLSPAAQAHIRPAAPQQPEPSE